MRLLPTKRSQKQKEIIWATFDYYGDGLPRKEIPNVRNVALWIMGRKKGITLNEEQKNDARAIKENLKDKIYMEQVVSNPPQI